MARKHLLIWTFCLFSISFWTRPGQTLGEGTGRQNANCFNPKKATTVDRTSIRGQALDFDGVDDAVEIPHHPDLNLTQAMTFESWVFIKGPNGDATHSILDKTQEGDLPNYRWYIETRNKKFGFYNGKTRVVANYNLPTGKWIHLASVFQPKDQVVDGKGIITFYLNGIEIGTQFTSLGKPNKGPLFIGKDNNQVYPDQQFINLKLDDLRLWNRTLSQEEIQASMHCELSGDEPALVLYFSFNQGVGEAVNTVDSILIDGGGIHHGKLQDFALNGVSSNWVSQGGIANWKPCGVSK